MFYRKFASLIVLVLYGVYLYDCLHIIPERAVLTYVNEKYITNVSVAVRRSSKRGEYVFNMKLINKTLVGNNVTFHLIVYEHSSRYNQYVRTVMEFHFKWCDLILRDMLFGSILRKNGLRECPSVPGPMVMANMTISGNFPFEVLFDKGKLEGSWKVASTGEVIGSVDLYAHLAKSH